MNSNNPPRHNCTPRSIPFTVNSSDPNYNYILPDNSSPIDEVLTNLLAGGLDDKNEIILNGLKLVSTAEAASWYIAKIGRDIVDAIKDTFVEALAGNDGDELAEQAAQFTVDELRTLFTIGFLSGTAIGFVTGREFEREFVEDDGGDDDGGYPPHEEN